MENHDPGPPGPDPLRDGQNQDRAAGLVSYHVLQRMWEESHEDQQSHWEETNELCDEPPVVLPPNVPPRVSRTGGFLWGFLWIMGGILAVSLIILVFVSLS